MKKKKNKDRLVYQVCPFFIDVHSKTADLKNNSSAFSVSLKWSESLDIRLKLTDNLPSITFLMKPSAPAYL